MPINKAQPAITHLLIDLDETIYPSSNEIWPLFRARLDTYLREQMGFPPEQVNSIRDRLFYTYGSTLRGLQIEFDVDTEDYLDYVHDADDVENYLSPDPELRAVLAAYPQPKIIFTNASREHAQRILEHLQLADLFCQIIDIRDVAPYCKPQLEAFQVALQLIGNPDPKRCLFADDTLANLQTALDLGMQGVLVGKPSPDGIPAIAKLADLPSLFPI